MKLLFEIASLYGFDDRRIFAECLYICIFQLAFSIGKAVPKYIINWKTGKVNCFYSPEDTTIILTGLAFQQNTDDYIDIAKLAQMLPVVGAAA